MSIQRQPKEVYDFMYNLENFPSWATAFCHSISYRDNEWIAETSEGPVKVKFVDRNDWGILDHDVGQGENQVQVPVRVIPNGSGSEVIFTVFQAPNMSREAFKEDIALIESDLKRLKRVLEETSK